jgi:predicted RNase H-like HicB family nuclease
VSVLLDLVASHSTDPRANGNDGLTDDRTTPHAALEVKLTFVFQSKEHGGGFAGFIAELPGPYAQGATLGEVRDVLKTQLLALLDENRALALKDIRDNASCETVLLTSNTTSVTSSFVNTFTAIYEETGPGWYAASAAELRNATTGGKTLDEAQRSLQEAIKLVLKDNRQAALDKRGHFKRTVEVIRVVT